MHTLYIPCMHVRICMLYVRVRIPMYVCAYTLRLCARLASRHTLSEAAVRGPWQPRSQAIPFMWHFMWRAPSPRPLTSCCHMSAGPAKGSPFRPVRRGRTERVCTHAVYNTTRATRTTRMACTRACTLVYTVETRWCSSVRQSASVHTLLLFLRYLPYLSPVNSRFYARLCTST